MTGGALGPQAASVLVPGDPGSVVRAAYQLRDLGDSLAAAGDNLSRIETDAGWCGAAADAFRSRFASEPPRWQQAGRAFHDAGAALDRYAAILDQAQRQAADAVVLSNQGQAESEAAIARYNQAVVANPALRFVDPGEPDRARAQRIVADARSAVRQAGDAAMHTVAEATKGAPEAPGFWSKVGDVLGAIGDGVLDLGAGLVNGLASFGNAMANHPGDLVTMLAGVALTDISAGGELLGVGLDATGVGSIGGVPLNIVSAAGIAAGATITAGAVGDLTMHAVTDDRVSPMEGAGGDGEAPQTGGTKTDRYKEHLTDRDLDAARRELDGEVVATKADGTPWNHVQEVRESQNGLVKRIQQLQRQLGDTRTAPADRPALEAELSEASRLLDHSEQFVPRS